MGRLLRALRHCIRETWDGLWRNPALSLLSAAAIGISLYVLGLFLLLAFNLNRFVEDLGREMQVQVYLQENATVDQIRTLRAEFASDPAIAEARFITKTEARRRFQRDFPTLRDLPERVGGNPFPVSFELEIHDAFRDPESLDRIAKSYKKAPGVEEVRYDRGWTERLAGIVGLVQKGGYGIGALLAFAALVTVGATVRLTVLALIAPAALGLAVALGGPAPAAESTEYTQKMVLQNDRVRAQMNYYPAGTSSPEHEHKSPRAVVVVEGGTLEIHDVSGKTSTLS